MDRPTGNVRRVDGVALPCPFVALRAISRTRQDEVAFGRVRTSKGRLDWPARSRMTRRRHTGVRRSSAGPQTAPQDMGIIRKMRAMFGLNCRWS
jgi:hypothetical protein